MPAGGVECGAAVATAGGVMMAVVTAVPVASERECRTAVEVARWRGADGRKMRTQFLWDLDQMWCCNDSK